MSIQFNQFEEAKNYCRKMHYPLVIKADGLAAGKGVLICNNIKDAKSALNEIIIR